ASLGPLPVVTTEVLIVPVPPLTATASVKGRPGFAAVPVTTFVATVQAISLNSCGTVAALRAFKRSAAVALAPPAFPFTLFSAASEFFKTDIAHFLHARHCEGMSITWYGNQSPVEGRNFGPLAVIVPLIERMRLTEIIDRHIPADSQAEFPYGRVLS